MSDNQKNNQDEAIRETKDVIMTDKIPEYTTGAKIPDHGVSTQRMDNEEGLLSPNMVYTADCMRDICDCHKCLKYQENKRLQMERRKILQEKHEISKSYEVLHSAFKKKIQEKCNLEKRVSTLEKKKEEQATQLRKLHSIIQSASLDSTPEPLEIDIIQEFEGLNDLIMNVVHNHYKLAQVNVFPRTDTKSTSPYNMHMRGRFINSLNDAQGSGQLCLLICRRFVAEMLHDKLFRDSDTFWSGLIGADLLTAICTHVHDSPKGKPGAVEWRVQAANALYDFLWDPHKLHVDEHATKLAQEIEEVICPAFSALSGEESTKVHKKFVRICTKAIEVSVLLKTKKICHKWEFGKPSDGEEMKILYSLSGKDSLMKVDFVVFGAFVKELEEGPLRRVVLRKAEVVELNYGDFVTSIAEAVEGLQTKEGGIVSLCWKILSHKEESEAG